MKKLVTISICTLHFVMSMIMLIILPKNVPMELMNLKVSQLANKWLGLTHVILPFIVSLSMLFDKSQKQNMQKSFSRRDALAIIICYIWIIVGWTIFAINANPNVIGTKITLPYLSLVFIVICLVWSVFTYKIKNFNFSNPYKQKILIWLNYISVCIFFILATIGVIVKDNFIVLIIDAVFVVLYLLATLLVPKLLYNRIKFNHNLISQKFYVKGASKVKIESNKNLKRPVKIKPSRVKVLRRKNFS